VEALSAKSNESHDRGDIRGLVSRCLHKEAAVFLLSHIKPHFSLWVLPEQVFDLLVVHLHEAASDLPRALGCVGCGLLLNDRRAKARYETI